jgi:hypothetical protein
LVRKDLHTLAGAAVAGLVLALLPGCTGPADLWWGTAGATPGAAASVPAGAWGGPRISLIVTAAGANYELDCAHGTIEGPLALDGAGRFSARGMHVPEQGGPVRSDDPPAAQPALYTGALTGQTLTLTIFLPGENRAEGTFTLERDQPVRLVKCL